MKGIIINFRRGRKTQRTNHFVIEVEGIDSREKAKKLAGKEVVWKSPAGKEIKGKIAAAHGNSGAVRAIFEKGLPGQAVSSNVEVI